MDYRVQLATLPRTLDELKQSPLAGMTRPEHTAALTIAALCVFPSDREECYKMLDYLRGPRPLSPFDKQFIRDRFMDGVDYVPRSYFMGAKPENDYQPSIPYTIVLSDSASQFADDGYRKFDVRSGGADSPRQITLRVKPSSGQWFLWEQMLLAQIRKPQSADPWA